MPNRLQRTLAVPRSGPRFNGEPLLSHTMIPTHEMAGSEVVNGETIFVAEDDVAFGRILAELLSAAGFRPVVFQGATPLLRSLHSRRPSLIVTDLALSGMSGAELLRALRRDEAWRSIPVIVMTDDNDTALPLRVDAPVLYKPDVDALLAAIRSALSGVGR
jgi:two-component system nitrogen regulation response regulator GlnG